MNLSSHLTIAFSILAGLLVACGEDGTQLRGHNTPGSGDPNAPPGGGDDPGATPPGDPALCTSKTYLGFDSKVLSGDRVVANIGVDRLRLKPFGVLQTEYPRVLGNTPASLAGTQATFGNAPQRWYDEPESNAVALETAYDIAFDGCLTYVATDTMFAAAPSDASAKTACAAMARKFWSKTPSPDEIQACADVAVNSAAAEPQTARKWAYACASVMTSAGFMSY